MPPEDSPAMHDVPSETGRVRADIRRLGNLAQAHIALGMVGLGAIALRTVLIAEERTEAIAMALVAAVAFAYLGTSVRLRAGQSLLRQELFALTLEEERRRDRGDAPYRSMRPDADERTRRSAARWRRLALALLVTLAAMLVVSVLMGAHVLLGATTFDR
jgi:hypothetical protein